MATGVRTDEDRAKVAARSREYYRQGREAAFEKLGALCGRCGFSDRRALQIDHVGGGGHQERLTYKGYHRKWYKDILTAPEGKYQVLCANCNQIKRSENAEYRRS